MANIFRPSTWLRGKNRPEPTSPSPAPARTHSGGVREATTDVYNDEEVAVTASSNASLHEQIEQRAYFLWCEAGCPTGQDVNYWLAAERELLDESLRD
jgi:hypothetical protein